MIKKKPSLNDLSIIVPIGAGDSAWRQLASDLISLPLGAEIIFVATQFEAGAVEILSKGLAPGRKVRWITAMKGRASQMNAGALQASKPFLWFLHSDSLLEESTLIALEESLIRAPNAFHFFQLKFSESLNGLMKLNEWGVKFRSEVLKMPFGDQGFVISKEIFWRLGGYPLTAPYGEDHLLIWKARQEGVGVVRVDAFIQTSARKYQNRGWLKTTLNHQWLTYKQAWPEWLKLIKKTSKVGAFVLMFPCMINVTSAEAGPVWIDTDISIGVPFKDVDDGYAIAHAVTQYPERVVGISVGFGNSNAVNRSHDLTQEILDLAGQSQIPVYLGAQDASDLDTEAATALARTLQNLSEGVGLTILEMGRLTNIQAALLIYPEGASRISEIVFIGGRRLESEPHVGRFQVTLTDSNFWGDEASFQFVLDHKIPLTLMSTDLAQTFSLNGRDLRVLKRETPLSFWLAKRSELWLKIWQITLGADGFYPFDLMASAYLTQRSRIHCDENIPLQIMLLPDTHFFEQGNNLRNRPVVSYSLQGAPYSVRYCDSATDDFADVLFGELSSSAGSVQSVQ